MKDFFRHQKGFVRIRLQSKEPERFLQLCAHRGIVLSHILHVRNSYEMTVSVTDFFLIKPICKKTHSRVHILEKHGWSFFFYKNRKRKTFFVGIFCCCLLVLLLSRRIWNIHIEGNYSYSTQSILHALEGQDITHGIAVSKLNCGEISAYLREYFPNIIWVSAKIRGTRLLITLQENMEQKEEGTEESEIQKTESPCNISAEKSGRILHMVTRQGVPLVHIGEFCKKGEILVSGCIEILDDNKEVIRREYVAADADIDLWTSYSYQDEFSLIYKRRSYAEKESYRPFVQFGDYRITCGPFQKNPENYDSFCISHQLQLTENYYLPFWAGIFCDRTYQIETKKYSIRQAQELAKRNVLNFTSKLSERGVKIFHNDVKITINSKACISKGTFSAVEKIGVPSPVEIQSRPEERTLLNEQ